MDIFGIIDIPSWIFIFIFTLCVCHVYLMRNFNVFDSLGVPYPKPLPVFGNFFQDLICVAHDLDIEYNKKYGRVYGFYELNSPTLRVSDPDILKEVMVKQFNNFTDRRRFKAIEVDPVMSKIMTLLRGEEWKMTRNVMSPTFTSGKLKQMVPLIDKCTLKLVDVLAEKADKGESIDAKDIFISYLLEVIGSCAFGVEINSNEANKKNDQLFLHYTRRLIFARRMVTIFLTILLPRTIAKILNINIIDIEAMNYVKKTLQNVIELRQSGTERRNDFLQIMLDALKDANATIPDDKMNETEAKEKGAIKAVLTPDGVLAQSFLFLAAGFDVTSTSLAYISYCASTNPDCQEKLIEEIDRVLLKNDGKINWDTISQMTYLDMFISETLRMYPPGNRIDRQCVQETKIGDLRIPKGFLVNIPVYAIHHDEEFYPDPYKFDPERFTPENKERRNPYTYLAFGAGPRNCVGMRFAMMKVKLTVIRILMNFRFCPAPEMRVPIAFKRGCLQLSPVGGIHVKLTRRLNVENGQQ